MDLCAGLLLLALVLLLLAAVGHFIWLALAAMLRAVIGAQSTPADRKGRQRCARCGLVFSVGVEQCPMCGLDPESFTARELRDLEAAVTQIQKLVADDELDKAAAEQIYRSLEARQTRLVRGQAASPRLTPQEPPPVPEIKLPPLPAVQARPQPEPLLEAIPIEEEPAPPVVSAPTPVPIAPPPPSRSLGEMFAAFMEERNILWGELVGGLLIVGCSIALVISLWQKLEQIPYFPFLAVLAVSGGLFGAGQYTLRHWKLEATSRGLLVISTLLVPLDVLMLARTAAEQNTGVLDWLLEAGGLAVVTAMVFFAGKVLIAPTLVLEKWRTDWLLTLAVVGSSATQLFVPRWLDAAQPVPWLFSLLSLAPVVLTILAMTPIWSVLRRSTRLEANQVTGLFLFLGMASFAVAGALGFILYWSSEPLVTTLQYLAVPIAGASIPLLISGGLVHSRLQPESEETQMSLATTRLIGTGLILASSVLMLGGLILSWPRPLGLMVVGGFTGAVSLAVALAYRIPFLHLSALVGLTVGFTTCFHWLAGEFGLQEPTLGRHLWMLARSGSTAPALLIVALIAAIGSEVLGRTGRRMDSLWQAAGSGVLAILANALVIPECASAPGRAAFVFGVCGLGGLAINLRWRQPWISYSSCAFVAGCLLCLIYRYDPTLMPARLVTLALLAQATVLVLAYVVLSFFRDPDAFAVPFRNTAVGLVVGSLAFLLGSLDWNWLTPACQCACWAAAIWLVVAWRERWPILFAGFQIVLAVSVLLGVTAWIAEQDWFHRDLTHVWSLQAYALGLGAFCLIWSLLRVIPVQHADGLLNPPWWSVDRLIRLALVPTFLIFVFVVLWPDIVKETFPMRAHDFFLRDWTGAPIELSWAWFFVGFLGITLAIETWRRQEEETPVGLLIVGLIAAVLVAHGFREERASASALRWTLSLGFVLLSIPIWVHPWERISARVGRTLLILGAVVPVFFITVVITAFTLAGHTVPGPEARSVFAKIGSAASMLTPLGLIGVGFVGHAIREQASAYIFAAGQVFLATLMGGYALGIVTSGAAFGEAEAALMVQLGGIEAAGWCLIWLWTGRWRNAVLLGLQTALALGANLLLIVTALVPILVRARGSVLPFIEQIGAVSGWIAALTALGAGMWYGQRHLPRHVGHILAACGVGLGVLAACSVATWDATGWTAYHVLTLSWTLFALFLLASSWISSNLSAAGPMFLSPQRRTAIANLLKELFPPFAMRRWVEVLSLAVVLLALFGAWQDPNRPYWSCAATLAVSILIGALAVWTRKPRYVYVSGLLTSLVGYLVWQAWLVDEIGVLAWVQLGPGVFDRLVLIEVLCLAGASAIWSIIETILRRREPPIDLRAERMPFAHLAAVVALQLLTILVLVALASDFVGGLAKLPDTLTWISIAAVAVALAICFWDAEAHLWGLPLAPLYELGLVAIALWLHEWSLETPEMLSAMALSLALYVLLGIGLSRFAWTTITRSLAFPTRAESMLAGWFLPANGILGVSVVGLSLWICLERETEWARLMGPASAGVLVIAGACFPDSPGRRLVRVLTLSLAILSVIEVTWALLDPECQAPWLHRQALALAVLTVGAVVYLTNLAGLIAQDSAWGIIARLVGRRLAELAGLVLAAVLVQEFLLYDPASRRTPLALPAMLLVAGLLLGVVIGCLWLAVSQRNLLGLGDRGRVRMVWGAEFLLLLLLVHLRLNVPDLFPSFLGKRWAFVLLFWSFVGIGLGEWSRRRNLPMLAEPLHRTGLFLPLLPLIAFLARSVTDLRGMEELVPGLSPLLRYLERLPSAYQLHALLWFLVGGLYALVAVMRRATGFALLAALMANFGLWVIYANQEDLSFLLHPQIWLIPLGLIILAAEHLNRPQLAPAQSQSLRYFGLLMIYVSSTADMFITGLGHSVILPIILAMLSVAGVLAGILLRVQAFLYQGVLFLFLVIFAQIWHAAVNRAQTWVWWASGVVLGVLILALFGLFEKRRNDVMRVIQDFKKWQ